MALEVKLDTIDRSSFEADTRGIRYLQAGVAIDISETDPAKILAKIPNLPGVPGLGTPHKVYPQAMVTGYRVSGISAQEVQFFVVYESPAGYGLNFIIGQWYATRNRSVSEEMTWLDVDNNPILVVYQAPKLSTATSKPASCRKRFPHIDLILTGVFLNGVTNVMENALGTINKNAWYGKPPLTWMCMGISDRPEILGYLWRITAAFSYKKNTWDALERWIDPHSRQAPTDITKSDVDNIMTLPMSGSQQRYNGITRARLYPLTQFELLFGSE